MSHLRDRVEESRTEHEQQFAELRRTLTRGWELLATTKLLLARIDKLIPPVTSKVE